jgi:predicted metalloprotease with PDZ domain
MLDLFKATQATKDKKFSTALFKNIMKKYIPHGIDKEIADFIEKGKTIDLSNVTTNLPLQKINMGVFDLGFDLDTLVNEYVIKNIDIKSNAYKAGLREGNKAIGWDITHNPDQIATIITANNNVFKYRPEQKKDIYQ